MTRVIDLSGNNPSTSFDFANPTATDEQYPDGSGNGLGVRVLETRYYAPGPLTRLLHGPIGASMIGTQPQGTTSQVQLDSLLLNKVNLRQFGSVGDGLVDDTSAFEHAIPYCLAHNCALELDPGTYKVTRRLDVITTGVTSFTDGLVMFGRSQGSVIIKSYVNNDYVLKYDTNAVAVARFQRNMMLKNITLDGSMATGGKGVYTRHLVNSAFDTVLIQLFKSHGWTLEVTEGDTDGSNQVQFNNSRIYACATDGNAFGFNLVCGAGHNEASYIGFSYSSITGCGKADATYPPTSGGARIKGQQITFEHGYISECQNTGLYIYGDTGISLGIFVEDFTLENNTKYPLLTTGVVGLKIDGLDLRNNDSFVATKGLYFDTTTYTVSGVTIDNVEVSATSGNNPYVLFDATGANGGSIRIDLAFYRTFGTTGQTKFGAGIYAFADPKIVDGNVELFAREKYQRVTINATSTFTPDMTTGQRYIITLTSGISAGTLTIGAPNQGSLQGAVSEGQDLDICINNTSGGTVNLAYGIGNKAAPTTIANNVVINGHWRRDNTLGYVQSYPWN